MTPEAKVGIFVVTAVLLLSCTVYFVRTTQTVRGQVAFRTYFQDAGGLDADASVMFGGIKVGRITTVRPWADDPTKIEVVFEVKAATPMNRESVARVGTVTLMGSPVLQVTTGRRDAARLEAGDTVPSEEVVSMREIAHRVDAVAASANALLLDLRQELPALTARLHELLANVNAITGSENQRQLRAVLAGAASVMKNVDTLVASAGPLVANVDQTVTNVNRTVDAVRDPLVADLTALRGAVQDVRALIGSMQGVVHTNEDAVAQTMRALRITSENLAVLSEQLKQRPWNLIRTTQPRDRKVPQ